MATSRSFGQFARRMTVIGTAVGEAAIRAKRRIAIVGDQVAVSETPVKTGNARVNWRASVDAPDTRVEEYSGAPQAAGRIANQRNQAIIDRARTGTIFLSNSVPYIIPLDTGSSAQSPAGMSQAAIQAMRAEARRQRLLKGL